MNKRFITVLGLLLFALLLGSCKEEQVVKIGVSVWPAHAYTFIAQEKGLFKKHGVSVELVLKKDVSEVYDLYKSDELDGFFGVFSDAIMLNANTFFTQVVYVPEYTDTADVIVGRPELNSLNDLKGKKVAFEGINSFSHLFVLRILEEIGISEGEYEVKNIPAQEMLVALENNQVDAGHTWEPITSQALAKGYKILGKAGDFPTLITGVTAFRKDFVDKHPETVQAIVSAFMEAKDFMRAHPDEAISIMAKAENMSEEAMANGIAGVHFVDLTDNISFMQPGGRLFNTGQKVIDFYIQNGLVVESPDLQKVINGKFVKAINAKI